MDVSDRRRQVQLTKEAKIATDFHFISAIFAVVGFISALKPASRMGRRFSHAQNCFRVDKRGKV